MRPPFGTSSGQASARAPGARTKANELDLSDYPKTGTCCTCCSFFIFLLVVPVSIVCLYHAIPTTILVLAGVWIMLALAPWAFHAGGVLASDISGPALTVTLFISMILSFLGGVRCYYEHVQPMRQLALAREYQGVYPELPGTSFPDAAYMDFAGNVTIDSSKGVSYQSLDSGLATICVAPVASLSSVGRHDFWAIGVDCCSGTGDQFKFDCYDAGSPGVKTGWVLPPKFNDKLFYTLGIYVTKADYRHDLFSHALKKAESVHGITSLGDETILLRWTKEKKEDIIRAEIVSVVITIFLFAGIVGALSFFSTRLYQRFTYIRRVHRRQHHYGLHGDVANTEEEDITARLQQFMADALEGAHDSDFAGTIDRVKGASNVDAWGNYRPPQSVEDVCLMGVVVPYVLLMLCVILSTYSPCWRFGHLVLAPFVCMTFILILALISTPNRVVSGLFIFLCCTAGYYIGQVNHRENMFHYCSTGDRRMYVDVRAEASTADYWDAGRIDFEAAAMLSTNHSVGFLYEGTTYCAAPVVSTAVPCQDGVNTSLLQVKMDHVLNTSKVEDGYVPTLAADIEAPTFMQRHSSRHRSRRAHARRSSSKEVVEYTGCKKIAPAQVEFWAIGVDCCDARRRFWCDGGEVQGSRQAVVVRAFGDEDSDGPKIKSDRRHFFQAVDQAVAAYGLPLPDRPVLLRWGADSERLQGEWKKRATGVILITGLASLLLILAISITSFCFMKRQRRLEKRNHEEFDRRQSGQAAEATVYDSPRPSLPPADSARNLGQANDAEAERRLKMSEDEMRF